jgi:hypothetical protein
VIVAGALIAAALIGAYQYLQQDESPAVAEQVDAGVPPPVEQKPDPLDGGSDRLTVLPGDGFDDGEGESAAEEENPAATAPPSPPVASSGPATEIRVISMPTGAYVVVDERTDLSCTAPCSLQLPRGRHTLAATKPGYKRTLRILEVPHDDDVVVQLESTTGTLFVRSEPAGAEITVDGQPRPERTPAMLTLPVGSHVLEIVSNGRRQRRSLTVREGSITNVTVSFETDARQ